MDSYVARGNGKDWRYDREEHARAQLLGWLASTPAQRLAWLEEVIQIAQAAGALPGSDRINTIPHDDERQP